MAKIRIRWRDIWRNLPEILMLMTMIRTVWPAAKEELLALIEDNGAMNSPVGQLWTALDELHRKLVRRA